MFSAPTPPHRPRWKDSKNSYIQSNVLIVIYLLLVAFLIFTKHSKSMFTSLLTNEELY